MTGSGKKNRQKPCWLAIPFANILWIESGSYPLDTKLEQGSFQYRRIEAIRELVILFPTVSGLLYKIRFVVSLRWRSNYK